MENRKKNHAKNLQLDRFEDLIKEATNGSSIAMMKALAVAGRGYDMSDEEIEKLAEIDLLNR